MEQLNRLKEKILSAPQSCGVYLMRDKSNRVIYVGKANSLRKRLLSYVSKDLSGKTRVLMSKAADVEFRLTADASMALLLEFALIHKFKPRYNISLKDDKSYPLVKVSKEKFPLISITRNKEDRNAQYFGPYTDTALLKNALKTLRQHFLFRSCKHLPKQSCIYYRINLCSAPCIGKISNQEYGQMINRVILILNGKLDLLIRELTRSMHNRSGAMDFETAARLRDQITALSGTFTKSGSANYKKELEDLKQKLDLNNLPLRIEGFDISNISGKQAVGSLVSFYNGVADKNNYRRFRIKSFSGIDDYKMLAEVIGRRYNRLIAEKSVFPDLILIDGGKGHLMVAAGKLKELNLHIPLVSIAKTKENVYGGTEFLLLDFPKDSLAMNLIRRIRDEAHRFAVGYHRFLRNRELLK